MSTVLTSENFSTFTSNNISLSAERDAGATQRVLLQFFSTPAGGLTFNRLQLYLKSNFTSSTHGIKVRIFGFKTKTYPSMSDLYSPSTSDELKASIYITKTDPEVVLVGDSGNLTNLNLTTSFSLKTISFNNSVVVPSNYPSYAIEITVLNNAYITFGLQNYNPSARTYLSGSTMWSSSSNGLIFAAQNIPAFVASFVGSKVFVTSNADPRVSTIQVGGQGLPDGSVVRWTSNSQKFYKISGGDLVYRAIIISAPSEWGWGATGQAAWATLQSL
jgi:hypothetical protein